MHLDTCNRIFSWQAVHKTTQSWPGSPAGLVYHVLCQGDTPQCFFKVAKPSGSQLGVVLSARGQLAMMSAWHSQGGCGSSHCCHLLVRNQRSYKIPYNAQDSPHNKEDPAPNVRRAGDEKLVELRGRAGGSGLECADLHRVCLSGQGTQRCIDLSSSSDIGWCDCGQVTKPFPALVKQGRCLQSCM